MQHQNAASKCNVKMHHIDISVKMQRQNAASKCNTVTAAADDATRHLAHCLCLTIAWKLPFMNKMLMRACLCRAIGVCELQK
jgi:hypothetical protein